ncbi:MAG TPA: hypothetical protein VGU44_01125, partial [Gammaproteobacteria bacterium]|nr:hypothetical protein [Gammaproteobacteria bacterium]
ASNVWFFTQLFYTTLFLYRDVKVIYFAEKEQSKLNGIILAEFDKQFDDYFPSLNVKNRLDLQLCYLSDKKGGKSLHMIFTLTAGSISHSTLLELWSTGLIIAAYTPAHKANRFVIGLPCHEKKDPKELKKHFSKLFNEAQITASKIETMRHFFHKHKLPMAWVVAEKPFNKKHLYYWIKDVPNDYAVILEKHKIAYEVCPDGGVLLALFKDNNLHQAAFVALYQSLKPQKPAQEMSIVTPPPEPAQTTYFDNDFQGSLWTVVYRKKLKPAPADKPIATVTAVEAPLREPVFDNLPEQYRGYRRIHLKDSHYYVFVPPQSSEFEKYNKWGATGNGYVPFVVNKENTGCIKIHDDRDVRYLAAPCTEGHYQAGSSGDQSKPRAYVLFPTDYSHKKINHLTLPQDIRHMRDSFYLETKRMLCKA